MAKKDTATAVLGLLSSTGTSTRPTTPVPAGPSTGAPDADSPMGGAVGDQSDAELDEPPAVISAPRPTEQSKPAGTAEPPRTAQRRRHASPTAAAGSGDAARDVPRTLRLRASTAAALRDAWLEAKRDDVLLSHQDFASDLLDSALARRRGARR